MSRRAVLAAGGGVIGGLVAASAMSKSALAVIPLPIVVSSVAAAVVVLDKLAVEGADPNGTKAQLLNVAADLVAYVKKSTGVELQTYRWASGDSLPDAMTKIYVGFVGPNAPSIPGLSDLKGDGFAINKDAPSATVTVAGATVWGTINGVNYLLRHLLGMEWLMPTTLGEDVPAKSTVEIPPGLEVSEPAFLQRMFSPLTQPPRKPPSDPSTYPYPDQYLWAQRQGLQGWHNPPIRFHHNMSTLFPREETPATYYPGGVVPTRDTGWQPRFQDDNGEVYQDTVSWAVNKINAYFQQRPNETSYSLGVNDGGGFAEPDPVDAYYRWVNAVASAVLLTNPGKWFGLLAYQEVDTPPSFSLNPKIVPFITQDRWAWTHSDVWQQGTAGVTSWRAAAAQVGFYDYTYGAPYMAPRIYPTLDQDILAFAHNNGVVALYDEAYPNWGEGPKPWIRARLTWDPNQDPTILLNYWCNHVAGANAGPYLVQYFQLWEDFWATVAPLTPWFQPRATYQAFNSGNYLAAIPAQTLITSRQLLDSAVAHPGTDLQQQRVAKLVKVFDYYEASATTFPREVPAPTTSNAAIVHLEDLKATWPTRQVAAQRRLDLFEEFKTDPLLVQPGADLSTHGLVWGSWNPSEFWGVVDYIQAEEPTGGAVTNWLTTNTAALPATPFTRYARLLVQLATNQLTSPTTYPLVNPSFETATGADQTGAGPWSMWVDGRGSIKRTTIQSRTGSASLVASGLQRGGPTQRLKVRPGPLAMNAFILAPGSEYAGSVGLAMNLFSHYYDSAGQVVWVQLGTVRGAISAVEPSSTWRRLAQLIEVPASLQGTTITHGQYVLILDGFTDDPDIFIDDMGVWQSA